MDSKKLEVSTDQELWILGRIFIRKKDPKTCNSKAKIETKKNEFLSKNIRRTQGPKTGIHKEIFRRTTTHGSLKNLLGETKNMIAIKN